MSIKKLIKENYKYNYKHIYLCLQDEMNILKYRICQKSQEKFEYV